MTFPAEQATGAAVQLAESVFGTNLMLAFIGGSRATGTAGSRSDIDVFVVISESDRGKERQFARELRNMHRDARLDFGHYGEIFSHPTLTGLLDFTEGILTATPAIADSACYRGNCLLSIFRKGQVVFGFLFDPKTHVRDRGGTLAALEERARRYFQRWGVERAHHGDTVLLPRDSEQQRLAGAWRDGLDTPVGIGLERWFGPDLKDRLDHLDTASGDFEMTPQRMECPLPTVPPSAWEAHAAQCLGRLSPGRPLARADLGPT